MTPTRDAPPELSAPALLPAGHDLSRFDCGVPAPNDWLRKRAMQNHRDGGSRTHVVCAGTRVVGYHCLSAGSVLHVDATGKVRRNMPDPIPVMVLGCLAVDKEFGGGGIGSGLLKDAALRTVQVAEIAGVRAMLLHAKDGEAKAFYMRRGFRPSPTHELTPMATLREILEALAA